MVYDSQYDEANNSREPDDEADASMEFMDESSDEMLYEFFDDIHPPPGDAQPTGGDTKQPAGRPAPVPPKTGAVRENVPDFNEPKKLMLTGGELLVYVCMIGILSGVAWWVTQELKHLSATREVQARVVSANTKLLPPRKEPDKPASTRSGKNIAGQNPSEKNASHAAAGTAIGSAGNLLMDLLASRLNLERPPGHSATVPDRKGTRELLDELNHIPSDASWMDRTLVLLPSWNTVPSAPEPPKPGFWEDPFHYGRIRVNQGKVSANNATKIPAKVDPITKRFVLSGILVVDGQPTAVINGRQVRKGDWIGDAKILHIDAFSVTIESNTVKHILRL